MKISNIFIFIENNLLDFDRLIIVNEINPFSTNSNEEKKN